MEHHHGFMISISMVQESGCRSEKMRREMRGSELRDEQEASISICKNEKHIHSLT